MEEAREREKRAESGVSVEKVLSLLWVRRVPLPREETDHGGHPRDALNWRGEQLVERRSSNELGAAAESEWVLLPCSHTPGGVLPGLCHSTQGPQTPCRYGQRHPARP